MKRRALDKRITGISNEITRSATEKEPPQAKNRHLQQNNSFRKGKAAIDMKTISCDIKTMAAATK